MTPGALGAIPVIDLSDFGTSDKRRQEIAREVRHAAEEIGFFYISGHGVDTELQVRLENLSRHFFSLPHEEKMQLRMALAGRAWRGYFPVGGELTSGQPDLKEGIYFGQELGANHPKVRANIPMHGANLFPDLLGFKDTVLTYMHEVTEIGHRLMRILSLSLSLPEDYFHRHFTRDPLVLFRIFHYPPAAQASETTSWGVGEHTDYGLLTILKQDDRGGLQIKRSGQWVEAPFLANTFICNIGDMLERMTGGLYKSTLHRVRNVSGKDRYSFPLFFDPGFDVKVGVVPGCSVKGDPLHDRWDQKSVHEFTGTYGDYILTKVGKVFPDLLPKLCKK
jgi:isopenicillin N synthase-like dioxygenase